jgi:hypothetical protein
MLFEEKKKEKVTWDMGKILKTNREILHLGHLISKNPKKDES